MTYVNHEFKTEVVSFPSGDGTCAAWLTLPSPTGEHPVVVLAHGLGATREMALPTYEQAFAAAGLAVLSFDYRSLGASPGTPRQLITVRRQLQDLVAAVTYARSRSEIDGGRVGIWGTSFGAAHALTVAARDPLIAATVLQCPIIDGLDAARRLGMRHALSLTPAIIHDGVSRITRRPRPTIGIVGRRGDRALVTSPGAAAGWESVMPVGYHFDNRVNPSIALVMLRYRPVKSAARSASRRHQRAGDVDGSRHRPPLRRHRPAWTGAFRGHRSLRCLPPAVQG
jgi:fermentation-respiration switch protein FrsA (DUF1100 family)